MAVEALPPTMRAALLYGPRDLRIEQVPLPLVGVGDALIAVDAVGLCGSDRHFFTGDRVLAEPAVLGHEIAGRIVAVGAEGPTERIGQRVTVEPNIPCGNCSRCRAGAGRICDAKVTIGQSRWGGLAEYVTVPLSFAWPVPEQVPLADVATIEPAAVAVHALSRSAPLGGATIAIVGCGGVGLLVARVALAHGHRVVVIEPNERRHTGALAAGVAAISTTRDPDAARRFFEAHEVATIIECAGHAAATQLCLDAALPGSRVVLVGLATGDVRLNPLRFARAELDLCGAIIYDHPADFALTIALVASGQLSPGQHTTGPYPLDAVPAIFTAMAAGTLAGKPIVAPRGLGSDRRDR